MSLRRLSLKTSPSYMLHDSSEKLGLLFAVQNLDKLRGRAGFPFCPLICGHARDDANQGLVLGKGRI